MFRGFHGKQIACLMVCALLTLETARPAMAGAGQPASSVSSDSAAVSAQEDTGYDAYARQNKGIPDAAGSIVVAGADYQRESGGGAGKAAWYGGRANVLKWNSGAGSVTYSVSVPKDAMYTIFLSYMPLEKNGADLTLGIQLDGAYPFAGMEALRFPVLWVNQTDTARKDSFSNELAPEQVVYGGFTRQAAQDGTGAVVRPYAVHCTAGRHMLTIVAPQQPLAVASIELAPPEQTAPYKQVAANRQNSASSASEPIFIQGENAAVKTSRSLIPKSDSSHAGMTPSNPYEQVLNYIGGTSWEDPGETLTWEVAVKKPATISSVFGINRTRSSTANPCGG